MKDWSLSYSILRFWVRLAHRIFYRQVIIEGRENIPKNAAVIFAANHQCAMMDPLAIILTTKRQTVFLARADIFVGQFTLKLFRFVKMLPIYRIQDGRDAFQKNEATFKEVNDILLNNSTLGIFPEGTHHGERYLLPLKKGIARIAFSTMEATNWDLDLKIVPVGIYYENYYNWKTALHVRYGKAISVKDYRQACQTQSNDAIIQLRNAVKAAILPLVIQINNLKYNELYENLRVFYRPDMLQKMALENTESNRFKADKQLIEKLDTAAKKDETLLENLSAKAKAYLALREKMHLTEAVLSSKFPNFFGILSRIFALIVLFPLFCYGYILNILPYEIPNAINRKYIEDPQFYSSIKLAISFVSFPVFYLLLIFIASFFVPQAVYLIAFAISLPLSAEITYWYSVSYKNTKQQLHLLKQKKNSAAAFRQLMEKRRDLAEKLSKNVFPKA